MAERIVDSSLRADVRAELVAMRTAAQQLFASLSEVDWRRRSANPGWSVGEVLAHVTWSLEQIPREVEGARKGRGMYNLPPILMRPINMLAARLFARRYTQQTIARQYEAAYAAVLHTLDGIKDDEWRRGAPFYGEGFKDIEELFRGQARHLAEHARDIWAVLPQVPQIPEVQEDAATL